MIDLIRTGLLASLGAAVVSKEKVEKMVNDLVNQGKMTQEESQQILKDMEETGKKEWSQVEDNISENIRKALDRMDIPRQANVKELEERVEQLEKKISVLENHIKPQS